MQRSVFGFAIILAVATFATAQDKGKLTVQEFLVKNQELNERARAAGKEKNVVLQREILTEQKALARRMAGASIAGEMTYYGTTLKFGKDPKTGRAGQIPHLKYGIRIEVKDDKGNTLSASGEMLPANEQYILSQIYKTAKPKDRFAIEGNVVGCDPGYSTTIRIAVKDFKPIMLP